MKKGFFSFTICLTIFLAGLSQKVYCQENLGTDFDVFLQAGADDANLLIKNYMEPLVMGFSYGMSNGWYNTAKAHKSLGFDLTITATLTSVPESKEYFTFLSTDYENVHLVGSNDQVPTILGPSSDTGPELEFTYYEETTGTTISSGTFKPVGLGLKEEIGYNVVPSPMVQLSVGTFKNTDLIIRYVPEIRYEAFTTSAFGFGIKHDIKQWIPGLKRVPIDIALLAAFSGFDNHYNLSDLQIEGDSKEAVFNVNNWTVQALVSKKISILTVYAGIGCATVNSEMKMKGTYAVKDDMGEEIYSMEDPITLSYEESSWRATGGIRLKFAFFTLHGDYTYQQYSMVSAGFGFSFR